MSSEGEKADLDYLTQNARDLKVGDLLQKLLEAVNQM